VRGVRERSQTWNRWASAEPCVLEGLTCLERGAAVEGKKTQAVSARTMHQTCSLAEKEACWRLEIIALEQINATNNEWNLVIHKHLHWNWWQHSAFWRMQLSFLLISSSFWTCCTSAVAQDKRFLRASRQRKRDHFAVLLLTHCLAVKQGRDAVISPCLSAVSTLNSFLIFYTVSLLAMQQSKGDNQIHFNSYCSVCASSYGSTQCRR
jgi:hypothetical protein